MEKFIKFDGIQYRVCRARYNGVWINDCLVPEDAYRSIKETKKRPSKTGRKVLEDGLDDLWQKAVKNRDRHQCRKCKSKTNKLEAHHIFTRSRKNTRWVIDNGITLCTSCHKFGNGSAHKEPLLFFQWLKNDIGEKAVKYLEIRSRYIASFSIDQLKLMEMDLKRYV